ncbi:MAG: Holliday junction resolvase RuvX [Defluviitaleaceae bacterium]|nr:Holliday junction resolvase RuvX [Defluviitaleaceae bacterium]
MKDVEPTRFLGLDFGEKTIGVAVSCSLNLIATPLEIIRRENEVSIKKSIKRLEELIKELNINTIILGYPKNMNNSEGPRALKTVEFKERLLRNFKRINVILWDERLSTVVAHNNMKLMGLDNIERQKIVDKVAASIILQSYLDYINNKQ